MSKRGTSEGVASYDALHEGIPSWLKSSLSDWIRDAVTRLGESRSLGVDDLLLALERTLRLSVDRTPRHYRESPADAALGHLQRIALDNPDVGLDVIDFLLSSFKKFEPHAGEMYARQLDAFLAQGGSAWRVGDGRDCLERRLADEMTIRARQVMATGTRPAEHLREAWTSAYGRHPNPGHSYGESIKAVEAAAIPIVSPENTKATLGTVISDLEKKPEKWTTTLTPTGDKPGIEIAIGMLKLLWKAQPDRPGTPDPSAPFAATQEEAEAAVHLALTLVHWFESGAIRRNTN